MKKEIDIIHQNIDNNEEAEEILRDFGFKWFCFGLIVASFIWVIEYILWIK
jgi:hypothetical protein